MPKSEPAAHELHHLRHCGTNPTAVLRRPAQITDYVAGISAERIRQADEVVQSFEFRLPAFYAEKVLNGAPDDPLLDIVFPSAEELSDGEELWDATPSPYRASDSAFWVQKYEFQGLIRVTTVCSGLCRFCYLKKNNQTTQVISSAAVDHLFDDLESRGGSLKEIILSGGDPLCAPSDVIHAIAVRMNRWRARKPNNVPHVTIHTREPVWDPEKLLKKRTLLAALGELQAKTYMINVAHPREVTPEFLSACEALSEAGGPRARPSLLCQHPLFKGVNNSVEVLEELYGKLSACSPPILPYYLVHPFYNGTLPKHRMGLAESQAIYAQLIRRPGCITPRLVVPTPVGKCVIGPHEPLIREGNGFRVTTKDGKSVVIS